MEELFENRPNRKPDETIPGRLQRWKGTDYVAFAPAEKHDSPTRTVISKAKGFCYYKNEGEKENSFSVHANVDGTSNDPAADLMEMIQRGMAQHLRKEPTFRVAKFVVDEEDFKVWFKRSDKQLLCLLSFDTASPENILSKDVFNKISEIYKIINSKSYKK